MNVSSLIHDSHTPRQHHSPAYHTYSWDVGAVSTSLPFRSPPAMTSRYSRTLRAPPSPPVEETTSCTLPSIQSLMVMAGKVPEGPDSPTTVEDAETPQRQGQDSSKRTSEARPYTYSHATVSNSKALPPTPPLGPKSGFDDQHQSPMANSRRSSVSTSHYIGSSINNMEPHLQRQAQARSTDPYPVVRQPSQSPYSTSPFMSSPSGMSSYSYPSPARPPLSTPGMYYQQPIPTTFATPDLSVASMTPSLSTTITISPIDQTNPWQHHHYISPSASAAFAGQTQDRYICQTCNKAFSRPSSLRIHSHSHTGEKPFKCQHIGCGKAFSVRSNMKRHERGCHGGGGPGSP